MLLLMLRRGALYPIELLAHMNLCKNSSRTEIRPAENRQVNPADTESL